MWLHWDIKLTQGYYSVYYTRYSALSFNFFICKSYRCGIECFVILLKHYESYCYRMWRPYARLSTEFTGLLHLRLKTSFVLHKANYRSLRNVRKFFKTRMLLLFSKKERKTNSMSIHNCSVLIVVRNSWFSELRYVSCIATSCSVVRKGGTYL